jgi:hypothetical protein
MIGLDFHYNYRAAREWLQGKDPYTPQSNAPAGPQYEYPPLTLAAFLWANLIPPGREIIWTRPDGRQIAFAPSETAILLWIGAILCIVAFAAWLTSRNRLTLGLRPLPFVFILGVTLCSYPVLFEIERANCDVLPMLAIAIGAIALSWRNQPLGDVIAGLCTACAIGIKPYTIVLLPGLLTLRRWRAFGFALVWLGIEAAVFAPQLRTWLGVAMQRETINYAVFEDWSHSFVGDWHLIWSSVGMSGVAKLPAQLCVGTILVAVCAVVGWRVYRRPQPGIAWPYLLWLTAVGTMLIPIAYDYNLLYLPFAMLAAWSLRDSWRVHVSLALVALWCQPFYFGITHLPLLALKVVSILLSGIVVVTRLEGAPTASVYPWDGTLQR